MVSHNNLRVGEGGLVSSMCWTDLVAFPLAALKYQMRVRQDTVPPAPLESQIEIATDYLAVAINIRGEVVLVEEPSRYGARLVEVSITCVHWCVCT